MVPVCNNTVPWGLKIVLSGKYFEVTYPEAQLPLADPPLLEHSLEKEMDLISI